MAGPVGSQRIPELKRAAQELESWNFPDVPLVIECSAAALEEIRSQAEDGLRRLARRGLEIGGVLYGTRRPDTIRIEAVRPIACQHAEGPGFVLSQADCAELREQIEDSKNDPELKNLVLLGWFVSHTRGGTELIAPDNELYSTYFPEPWQVTLAVHPRYGATSGAFFVRRDGGQEKLEFEFPDRRAFGTGRAEARGQLRPASLEADIRERAPLEPAPPRPKPLAPMPSRPKPLEPAPSRPKPLEPALLQPTPLEPASRKAKPARRRLIWVWLAVWVLGLGGLGWAAVRLVQWNLAGQPLALDLLDNDGQLRIEWNRNAGPVMKAVRGWLYIADGADSKTVNLNPQDLGRGSLAYERKSGSVEVRLGVENAFGHIQEEASRFLGAAPIKKPDPEELKLLEQRRKDLEAEVARLRAENAAQARRIAELEAAEKALRARVLR